MDEEAKQAIQNLRGDLFKRPSGSLIYAAKYIRTLAEVVSVEVPDFVEVLANGNPEAWRGVIEQAQADVRYEEVGHASA